MSEKMSNGEPRKRGTVTLSSRKCLRVRAGQTYINRAKETDSELGHHTESDTLFLPLRNLKSSGNKNSNLKRNARQKNT